MKKRDENSKFEMLESGTFLSLLLESLLPEGVLYVVVALFGYLAITWVSNLLFLFFVVQTNARLGVAMQFEFGWMGVRIIPIPIPTPIQPKEGSTDPREASKPRGQPLTKIKRLHYGLSRRRSRRNTKKT
jgi:hypothetical protein